MLRELSHLLDELHDGLRAVEARGGVQLSNVDMTLPLALCPVLRDGGCVLLADLPRSREVNAWLASPSMLRIGWTADVGAPLRRDAALPMELIAPMGRSYRHDQQDGGQP